MADDELVSRQQPVQEDMTMQQRVWRFERVGWYLLVVIVLLGLAGVFGNGPLSNAQVTSADGRLHVEYQRLSRSGTTDSLRITVPRQRPRTHHGAARWFTTARSQHRNLTTSTTSLALTGPGHLAATGNQRGWHCHALSDLTQRVCWNTGMRGARRPIQCSPLLYLPIPLGASNGFNPSRSRHDTSPSCCCFALQADVP